MGSDADSFFRELRAAASMNSGPFVSRTIDPASLQVRNCGQVSREFGDASRATPVRAKPTGVDERDIGRAGNACSEVAGVGVARSLGKIGVGVAQIRVKTL